jgi:hypothetical protein
MENNVEIRKRMETYRNVLLAVVWIGAIAGMIGGIIMIGSGLGPFGIAVLIISILGGILGHFLTNVALAIPFILLNNGDILESLKGKSGSTYSDDESNGKKRDVEKEKVIITNITNDNNDNSDNNTGKIKIIVERLNNVIYSAIPFEIFIDKKNAFSIEDASCAVDFVDNGYHSIYASLDYNTQSEIVNFNTDNSEIKFKLSVLGVGKIKLEKAV